MIWFQTSLHKMQLTRDVVQELFMCLHLIGSPHRADPSYLPSNTENIEVCTAIESSKENGSRDAQLSGMLKIARASSNFV